MLTPSNILKLILIVLVPFFNFVNIFLPSFILHILLHSTVHNIFIIISTFVKGVYIYLKSANYSIFLAKIFF